MAGDFVERGSDVDDGTELKAKVEKLVNDLSSEKVELQRNAAEELRLLTKRNAANRDRIAGAGAIPLLLELHSSGDAQLQVHAVTTLLNMSINHSLKEEIVKANAINPVVEVLRKGCAEAKENAAATLFSLASSHSNKTKIGFSGAFPPLVDLLRDGSCRGKRDAASCIFSLSVLPANRALAVRAGVVGPLMKLILDDTSKLQDEALATLALISSHQEGQFAVGQANSIPVLVEFIISGLPRNQENAIGILLDLGRVDRQHVVAALQLGVYGPLGELACTGSEKGRRRALRLLQLIRNYRMDVDATIGGAGAAPSPSSNTKFSSL